MFNIGPQELILILVVALLIVGPRRLPELGRSLGKGLREIRKAQTEVRRTIQENLEEEPRPTFADRADRAEGGERPEAPSGLEPGSVEDVSRSLGQGLAELRRAREEIQRSFRVDVGDPPPTRPRRPPRRPPATGDGETAPSSPSRPGDDPGGTTPPD